MRGDKKRFPLVLLIVVTLLGALGLTSLTGMLNASPAAVAAVALSPLSSDAQLESRADAPAPNAEPAEASPLSDLTGLASSEPSAIADTQAAAPVTRSLPGVLISAPAPSATPLAYPLPEALRHHLLRFSPDSEVGAGAAKATPDAPDAANAASSAAPGNMPHTAADTDASAPDPASPAPVLEHETYEVTAYYLNVRVHDYNGSKVLRVVSKGTRLEVLGRTDNGWLQLKDGGYVHGGYAERIDAAAAGAAPATGAPPGEAQPQAAASSTAAATKRAPTPTQSQPKEDDDDLASPTSRIASDSGLTEAHIAKLFEGTALAGHGIEEVVLEIEDEYGINALFTIAVMKLESGNGKSRLSRTKNNLFGLNATSSGNSKAFSFKTKGDSVRKFGQLLADNYVDKGYTTVAKVASKYCPASSSWAGKVMNIMKSDYRKL